MSTTINNFPIIGLNPEDTPITRDTIGSNDKFILQNGATPKVITPAEAIKLFAPIIRTTPLSYVPTPTGNVENLNEYVTGSDGKKYFIDAYGNAVERLESRGRYASVDDAISIGNLQDGERFTLNNPNHPLHGGIIEVIV